MTGFGFTDYKKGTNDMGLSEEQLLERKNDEHVKYITSHICDKDGKKPYVFISYKSDDWKVVLQDIVYRLVKEYGLNVYFDGSFDSHNSLWIEQFPDNMESELCQGVLAFVDDKYATSYATLLELINSQAGCQDKKRFNFYKKPVVPICLSKLTQIDDESDTGLGTDVFEDGTKNVHAKDELETFNELFDRACENFKIFKKSQKPYNKNRKNNTDILLPKNLCSVMVEELLLSIGANDNYYDKSLDGIVQSIKDVCGEEVFSEDGAGDGDGFPCTERLWVYRTKGVCSTIEWDGSSKSCVVLKGSKAAAEAAGFAKLPSAKKLKDELIQEGVLVNDEFVKDYPCNKVATMINVLNGGSVSMPDTIRKGNLAPKDGTMVQKAVHTSENKKQGIKELI